MNLANKLTFLRVILAPVFFCIFYFPLAFPSLLGGKIAWTAPALWLIFFISQITDYFDGLAARKLNQTSDFGKFFDPFADTLMQLTCFLCFVIDGILPAALYLIVIYREFGVLFIRNLLLKKGITLGAKMSGKVKTVFYIIAGGFAIFTIGLQRMEVLGFLHPHLINFTLVLFIISVILSVYSFIEYLLLYLKSGKTDE